MDQRANDLCKCFICDKPDLETKLRRITKKGIQIYLKQAKKKKNFVIVDWLNEGKNSNNLYYHEKCKNSFNYVKASEKDKQSMSKRPASSRNERINSKSNVNLPFKNRCILCNELVNSTNKKGPEANRKLFRIPDNLRAGNLKEEN